MVGIWGLGWKWLVPGGGEEAWTDQGLMPYFLAYK